MAEHAKTDGTDFAGADAAGHAAHPAEAHGGGHGAHADAHGGHHDNPHLHHHFDTEQQQFDSDKLGMWLFLTTEILLFAGLFCAYAVYRANHPEMFLFAHKFLDVKWGFLNTIVLLFSSFTMAWAVRAAQLGQKKLLVGLLAITIACGGVFLGVKYIEYSSKFAHGTLWGKRYKPNVHALEEHVDEATLVKLGGHAAEGAPAADAAAAGHGSAEPQSPAADTHSAAPTAAGGGHGAATGAAPTVPLSPGTVPAAPEAGKENEAVMPGSTAAAEQHTQGEGVIPDSSTPSPGTHDTGAGATVETEPSAAQVHSHGATAAAPSAAGAAPAGGTAVVIVDEAPGIRATSAPPVPPATAPPKFISRDPETGKLLVDHSHVPPAAQGPDGLAYTPTAKRIGTHESSHEAPHGGHQKWHGDIPPNPQIFFSIYFMMTGLHGIHVVIGMICILVVMLISMRGGYGADYMTPVDLVGLYWHLVDLIWIFLFPLLYLIH